MELRMVALRRQRYCLRYPDVFHVAVANSAVTDWRNYDNVYTERFMNLLENNLKRI
jgi:dipeptidyl-peptidase-4